MQAEAFDLPAVGPLLESAVYVADLDRSAAFYQRVFGFPQYLRDQRMCALGVPGAAVLLLFVAGGSETSTPTQGGSIPGHGAAGRTHLCFKVAEADLARWEAHLGRLGIEVESRVTWHRGGTSLYFRDPDEHSLEVASPGLWPGY
jgi:catechol 2,3-dioxygenase-like lactoylglutathione lyase family enzyme